MKGDFSRLTFRQDKHYSSVRLQQGRVQLDADWNEQIDIQAHHDRTAARDAVGPRGAPLDKPDSFKLSVGGDSQNKLMIGCGRYYVDGILCENEKGVGITVQPNYPEATWPKQDGSEDGYYLAYLDVWQRLVTAVEDPSIREVALAGPDTATRTQTVWQVKLQKLNKAADCEQFSDNCENWKPAGEDFTGKLRAQPRPPEDTPGDPCVMPPGAGYTRLENQLYRVEIHDGGEPYGKRSRKSTITTIEKVSSRDKVQVVNDGQTWRVNQWVELFREGSESAPGTLIRITRVDADERMLTLDIEGAGIGDLSNIMPHPNEETYCLRRVATFKFSRHNGAILARQRISGNFVMVSDPGKDPTLGFAEGKRAELIDEGRTLRGEPGVMVELASVTGNNLEVVWPNGTPMKDEDFPTPPATVRRWDSEGAIPVKDQRNLASAVPGDTRMSWQDLEDGVQVGFEGDLYRCGDYWLIPARSLGGEVEWPRNANGPSLEPPHGIEHHYCPLATLKLVGKMWELNEDCRKLFPPLTQIPANKVEYNPNDQCTGLKNVTTVQDAIDELCKTEPGAKAIRVEDVRTIDPDERLANDTSVPASWLAGGLRVLCDTAVDRDAVYGKPTCLVTLEMPYPFSQEEKDFWKIEEVVGYRPLVLRGEVTAEDESVRWAPAKDLGDWLLKSLFQRMAEHDRGKSILAHLTLKGNFIWAKDNRYLFLDGEAVSKPTTQVHPVGLDLPSGDRRRGGDFEMWFRIKSELFSVNSVQLSPSRIIGGQRPVEGTVRMPEPVTNNVKVTVESDKPAVAYFHGDETEIVLDGIHANQVEVASDGESWQVYQWVELFKEGSTAPGPLMCITHVDEDERTLTLDIGGAGIEDLSKITPPPDRLRRASSQTVTVRSGQSTAPFHVFTKPTLTDQAVSISAFSEDQVTEVPSEILQVTAPQLQGFSLVNASVPPGGQTGGSVSWRGSAPAGMQIELDCDARGQVSLLSEDNPSESDPLPSTLEIDKGTMSKEFHLAVSANVVPGQTIVITAKYKNQEDQEKKSHNLDIIS